MAFGKAAELQRQGLISDTQAAKLPAPDDDGDDDAPASEGTEQTPVGLCQNPAGVPFQCGTCHHFQNGVCENPDPRLNGQQVDGETMCCNEYDHDGMRKVIP